MKKNNIILDLDQTLIYGEPVKDFKNNFYQKAIKFTFYNMDNTYIIFERPHLQEFLDFLFSNFNVSIWTAASKDYALFVIKNVILKKPNRKLDFILVSYHCRISEKKNKHKHTKYLQLLNGDFGLTHMTQQNTFILDDYKNDVYISQPDKCILASEFIFKNQNSETDDFLSNLILKMKPLIQVDDVRKIIPEINKSFNSKLNEKEDEIESESEEESESESDDETD